MKIHRALYLEDTPHKGRGVFTSQPLATDTLIECSHVIVMTARERELLDQTKLHDYIFEWQPAGEDMCGMALGYISVYNHAEHPNCDYFMDYEQDVIRIRTIKEIAPEEELTINYNGGSSGPLWFDYKE